MSFIEKQSILSPTQYGFRPESSTEFTILNIVSSCNENINDKLFTGLIMIDLKKAFDSVTHSILLQKLEHYGFRGSVFNLFSSYLSNRQQYENSFFVVQNLRIAFKKAGFILILVIP